MPAARAARMASYRADPFAMMLVHVTTPVRMQATIPRFLSTPMLMLLCVWVCGVVCGGGVSEERVGPKHRGLRWCYV
jgi:hypothetical protein